MLAGTKFRGNLIFHKIEQKKSLICANENFLKLFWKIPGTCINILLMDKYKELVEELYTEPNNEEVLGSFIEINKDIDNLPSQHAPKKSKATEDISCSKSQTDIRSFFFTKE